MGFFKGDTGSIKLGETHVLPGVLGHEIRRAAGTTGRVDIHAIAWDFLEQFELPRRQLARMLCHIVRVDVVEGLITLELPVLPSYLAVTPSCPLLPWLCPGWNIAARTGGALAPSGVNFEPSASAPGAGLYRTDRGRGRKGNQQLPENTAGGYDTFRPCSDLFHWRILKRRAWTGCSTLRVERSAPTTS